ncbi:MAG: stage II sporulation protein M [Acidobacteriota bacterium]
MSKDLIERRKEDWKRLEQLTEQAQTPRGLRRFPRHELRELARIYRRTTTDLAIARVESRDQQLVDYLNHLLIRTHGIIYRPESMGLQHLQQFFLFDFPTLVRRNYRYVVAVIMIFFCLATFSFIATLRNEDFADFAHLSPALVQQIKARQPWWETLNEEAPRGAAEIIFNNAGIGLKAFSMSIFPVLGTVAMILPTAMMFGSINALILKYGMTGQLWSFMIGHMVLEFAAIFIASGAGLMVGMGVLIPGERTRRDALIERGQPAIKLLAGCLPIFFLAGLIEAFVSPLVIHPVYKIATSIITAIALSSYLILAPTTRVRPK